VAEQSVLLGFGGRSFKLLLDIGLVGFLMEGSRDTISVGLQFKFLLSLLLRFLDFLGHLSERFLQGLEARVVVFIGLLQRVKVGLCHLNHATLHFDVVVLNLATQSMEDLIDLQVKLLD